MAKQIILADLNTALKPLIEAINKLREELTTNSSQISEIHSMVTNLSVKLDTLEQTAGATLSEVSRPAAKKPTGRKQAAKKQVAPKKPPTRRGTKTPIADESEDTKDETVSDTDETEISEKPADPPVNGIPKKAAVKIVKSAQLKPKKSAVKKPTVIRLNKMTIFKDEYQKAPAQFDKYLTKKIKKKIADENENAWEDLSEDKLATAQRNAYYQYIKTEHDDILETLKEKHMKAKAAKNTDDEPTDATTDESADTDE